VTAPLRLADRLLRVKPSVTLAVTARAAELKARGVDVVSFGAGEPDFSTPSHIVEAASAALADGAVSKYTNVLGNLDLREVLAAELSAVHGIDVTPDRVLVSCGAKHSLYNVCMAMFQEGDEVIVPAPFWVSYPAMVLLAGADPVPVGSTAEEGYLLLPEDLEAAITPRTRAIVLNNPSNPTGAVYPRARLAALADVIARHDLFVISDDIYRSLVYGGAEYVSLARLARELAERTVFVDGVSKTYAMTGWRIGYATGPAALIKAMSMIQGQSTSNASHIAQVAAKQAVGGPQECVAEMREVFDQRRRRMLELLRAIPGVECPEPLGAFYAFPDLSAFIDKRTAAGTELPDDVSLAGYLVDEGQIAVVPGSGFGAPGRVRLSYACSMEDIEKGLARMAEALGALR
jgi:aspartate aminotransferase